MEAARHFISAANGDRIMASDLNNLEQALQTYFDGLYEGDTAKLGSVFHDVAHLFYVNEGNLGDMSREQWFDMVRSRKSAQSQDLKRMTGWCRSTAPVRQRHSPRCSARSHRATSPTTSPS